ncbi:hypothetical protein [uncultured Bacteroides sp.]|uniref:hypothetical protein n=1 Tax=uncultured Bacteroides sp. TaxID=162156 RepID=UPI0026702956|nr:hypothetical protein [uncultured Bacteroides sp.]
METLNIITPIVALVLGGSVGWLFTIKYTRRQAEADAMQHFQTVYQGLINDLKADRTDLRQERDNLADTIEAMDKRIKDLERTVEANARILKQLSRFASEKAPDCKGCVLIELISNSQL